jgi:hypothetical protein
MIDFLTVPRISAKITAETVAQAIIHGSGCVELEVIIPPQARLLYYLNVFSPGLADWATHLAPAGLVILEQEGCFYGFYLLPIPKASHPWLWNISLSYVPGPITPVLDEFTGLLLERFRRRHKVTPRRSEIHRCCSPPHILASH